MTDRLHWQPSAVTLDLIDAARDVLDDAAAAGYRFTLRRVFYALVSSGHLPNTTRSYKRLSDLTNRARWAGLLPRNAFDDLGRDPDIPPSWTSPAELLDICARQFRSDWWADADPLVEVWAEKQAVAGIVGPVADSLGVTFLACRGFSSLTALDAAVHRWDGRSVVLLYVGDHDPSGLDMDRDLTDRLTDLGGDIDLRRIALTVAQIDDHQLPPQPTKTTDNRAAGYSADHDGSWELDALPADVLAGLVRSAITELLPDGFDARRASDDDARAAIRAAADRLDDELL